MIDGRCYARWERPTIVHPVDDTDDRRSGAPAIMGGKYSSQKRCFVRYIWPLFKSGSKMRSRKKGNVPLIFDLSDIHVCTVMQIYIQEDPEKTAICITCMHPDFARARACDPRALQRPETSTLWDRRAMVLRMGHGAAPAVQKRVARPQLEKDSVSTLRDASRLVDYYYYYYYKGPKFSARCAV